MRVVRLEAASLGASYAQQDIYFQLMVDAALQVDDLPLAKSLLKERLAKHFTDATEWLRYIDMTHRIEQAHGQANGVAGKQIQVFVNTLVGVVCRGVVGAALGKEQQLQAVKRVLCQPTVGVKLSQPFAPIHL